MSHLPRAPSVWEDRERSSLQRGKREGGSREEVGEGIQGTKDRDQDEGKSIKDPRVTKWE